MLRKTIFDKLNSLYPTFAVGQHEKLCKKPYLVLKFDDQSKSNNTDAGGWQVFEVMVYVPESSISNMETCINAVIPTLKSVDIEFTGYITPDYHDDTVKAYMRSIQFRQPKGL